MQQERDLVAPESLTEAEPAPSAVDVILVPLDGSPFAERALPSAARLSERLDAEIHLLSAVARETDVSVREADLRSVEVRGGRVHRRVVVNHDPAAAVLEWVGELTRAVVCLSSHGRGRSAGVVGSVAGDIVARSSDPVVVVGPSMDDIAPWVPKEVPRSGVVVAVDETPESALLLPVALRWAALLREPLTVVIVAEPVPEPFGNGPARRRIGPEDDVAAFLNSLVAPIRASGANVATRAIWDPISATDGMRTYLREHPATLVVVGSRGRHGFDRLVFGSVAAGVIHGSPSPVLVVPRPAAPPLDS
jgi:nucleotide-binding universal stress UspA family protein